MQKLRTSGQGYPHVNMSTRRLRGGLAELGMPSLTYQ